MDSALDFGSRGCGFESHLDRFYFFHQDVRKAFASCSAGCGGLFGLMGSVFYLFSNVRCWSLVMKRKSIQGMEDNLTLFDFYQFCLLKLRKNNSFMIFSLFDYRFVTNNTF